MTLLRQLNNKSGLSSASVDLGFIPHMYFFCWLRLTGWRKSTAITEKIAPMFPLVSTDLPPNPWTGGEHRFIDEHILPEIVPKFQSLLAHEDMLDRDLYVTVNFMEKLVAAPCCASFLQTRCERLEDNLLASVLMACRRQRCMTNEVCELDGPMDRELEPSPTYSMFCYSTKFML